MNFSKRRTGVFNKANNLSILAFSPSGKPFSFGHPSVDSVLAHFLSDSPAPPRHHPLADTLVRDLGRQELQLAERLEAGTRRKATLEAAIFRPWGSMVDLLDADVEALGLPELGLLQSTLERAQAEAVGRAEQLAIEALQPSRRGYSI